MRVIVISDTHLHQAGPDLTAICERYCATADLVIHLGDWVRVDVLDYFHRFPLEAVAGNMDDAIIRERLPQHKTLTIAGRRVGMAHGCGYEGDMHELLRRRFPQADIILYGHTHRPTLRELDGVLFFNPGSLFHGRGLCTGSLGVLHFGDTVAAEHLVLQEASKP